MVIWNKPSRSNFLKTELFNSENWFDNSNVIKAFEYELAATFKETDLDKSKYMHGMTNRMLTINRKDAKR